MRWFWGRISLCMNVLYDVTGVTKGQTLYVGNPTGRKATTEKVCDFLQVQRESKPCTELQPPPATTMFETTGTCEKTDSWIHWPDTSGTGIGDQVAQVSPKNAKCGVMGLQKLNLLKMWPHVDMWYVRVNLRSNFIQDKDNKKWFVAVLVS